MAKKGDTATKIEKLAKGLAKTKKHKKDGKFVHYDGGKITIPKDVVNKDLYARVSYARRKVNKGRTSAYSSAQLVQVYKKLGGKYRGKKDKDEGLEKWFDEDWVDLNRPIKKNGRVVDWKKCGRKQQTFTDADDYPKCVPKSVAKKMSAKERKNAIERKHSALKKALKKYGVKKIPTIYVPTKKQTKSKSTGTRKLDPSSYQKFRNELRQGTRALVRPWEREVAQPDTIDSQELVELIEGLSQKELGILAQRFMNMMDGPLVQDFLIQDGEEPGIFDVFSEGWSNLSAGLVQYLTGMPTGFRRPEAAGLAEMLMLRLEDIATYSEMTHPIAAYFSAAYCLASALVDWNQSIQHVQEWMQKAAIWLALVAPLRENLINLHDYSYLIEETWELEAGDFLANTQTYLGRSRRNALEVFENMGIQWVWRNMNAALPRARGHMER